MTALNNAFVANDAVIVINETKVQNTNYQDSLLN